KPEQAARHRHLQRLHHLPPQLLHLGREYPRGADYFRERLRAFSKNKSEQEPERIKDMIARGEFVARELEALYYLRKFRAMKKRYCDE
ncbi:LYR motif-containing protein 5B-like, partial [Larimichthys crocea]|uniref:LYR motif-containing protein 5B-like n=1 Tax=Larimichthys crocea TaxID=215358 RepID=UPI000F5F2E8C